MALNSQELEKLKILLSNKEDGGIKTGSRDFLQKALPITGMVGGGIIGGVVGEVVNFYLGLVKARLY